MTFDVRPCRCPACFVLLVLSVTFAHLTAAGCGPSAGARRAVSGEVTLNGAPLDRGTITFISTSGAGGERGGALIHDGKYQLPAMQGLAPGVYRVEISSPQESTATEADYAAGKMPLSNPDRIASEFNTESNLTVEVKSDGPNVFDFAVR